MSTPLTAVEIERVRNGWRHEPVTTKEWLATLDAQAATIARLTGERDAAWEECKASRVQSITFLEGSVFFGPAPSMDKARVIMAARAHTDTALTPPERSEKI